MVNKKIALVIPSLQAGGMERVMSKLALYLSSVSELEIYLVLYGKSPELFFRIPSNVNVYLPTSKFNDKFRLISSIGRLIYLRRTIKKIRPDAVLSFGEYWNNFVLLALFGLKLPVYVSDRCQPDKSLGRVHDKLRKLLYPKTNGVIVQTMAAKAIYEQLMPKAKFQVIGNPIELNAKESYIGRENIILSIGRLINSKHHDQLISMFAELNMPDWKLIIVGADALKQNNYKKLFDLIQSLKCSDKVILAGNQKDVEMYYKKAKIFAFTSSSEGFPNVIIEALSFGLPVIAYDCIAGPSEIIQDGKNGFLIPLFNQKVFKEKLSVLMKNEELLARLSEFAPHSVSRFDLNTIGSEYLKAIVGK